MKGETISDPREFLERARAVFADEARHNLMLGIVGTLSRSPETYPEFHLYLVSESGRSLSAALQTPPYDLVVADTVNMRDEVDIAADIATKEVETVVSRIVLSLVTQMPFAADAGGVSRLPQHFGQR